MAKKERKPWQALDPYRNKVFSTEWPTFPQLIQISAERFKDNNCFTDFDGPNGTKRTFTYSQAYEKIKKLAAWMTANGIQKGDHVALTGKNSPEWAITYLAILCASATTIPLDFALHEKEVQNLLNTAKPKMIFVDDEKYETISKANPEIKVLSLTPKLLDVYCLNLEPPAEVKMNGDAEPNDLAAILFTSGTTGTPKGVMLTHENLISDCFIAQTQLQILPTDTFYALLPIHHAYTMQAAFINPVSVGAEIVFGKSMSVSRLLKELKEGRITIMLGVPLLYNKLLAGIKKGIKEKGIFVSALMGLMMQICYGLKKAFHINLGHKLFMPILKKASLSTLRVAICGGGPLAPSVFKAYNAAGIDFIQGYGLTETSPIIALNPIEGFKIHSVGKYFAPMMEMKIINPNEKGIGEIVVKGPMVMKGYYNMPEETKKVFTEDGFFKTGDLGEIDKDNYVILRGRAKNMIVTSGGKNVYPEEIEDSFQLCDSIQQIVVRGYKAENDDSSEEIEALIYPSDIAYEEIGQKRSDNFNSSEIKNKIQSIVDKINKTLQPYARITRIKILDKLMEMTTTQKVKRNYDDKNKEEKKDSDQAK